MEKTRIASEIKQVATEKLVPYARNARTHSDNQVAQIARSIEEFGFTNPVLVDGELNIIAGHGRVLAAKQLGIKVVPTIDLSYMTDEQRRAYIVADNQIALNAGWDMELLADELREIDMSGFNLELIGFDDATLKGLLGNAAPDAGETSTENNTSQEGMKYSSQFGVIVSCQDEPEQERIYNELKDAGYSVKVVSV
jgi:ParB-like chromosome segregation protein Spo0J